MLAWNRAGEPHTRRKLFGFRMNDETTAQRLVFSLERREAIEFAPVGRRAQTEDALADVRPRERLRILFLQLAAQRRQPAGVIAMVVAQDHIFDVRKIDPHFARVREHRFRASAGIEEKAFTVDFDERRITPFADACVSQHRGQHGDLERPDVMSFGGISTAERRPATSAKQNR